MPLHHSIDREAVVPGAVGAIPASLALLLGRRRTAAALLALPAALTLFFRDPRRAADIEHFADHEVVAPADGRVMHAGPAQPEVVADLDPGIAWQQISIFLSALDVHINRAPYAGTVESVAYRPGRWRAAYRFESAFENERSDIVVAREVAGAHRRYVVRQVVGLVARRVVTRIRTGDRLDTGQRIGLMKFGSRMDVFLPSDEVDLTLHRGQRVVAGETVIARWT